MQPPHLPRLPLFLGRLNLFLNSSTTRLSSSYMSAARGIVASSFSSSACCASVRQRYFLRPRQTTATSFSTASLHAYRYLGSPGKLSLFSQIIFLNTTVHFSSNASQTAPWTTPPCSATYVAIPVQHCVPCLMDETPELHFCVWKDALRKSRGRISSFTLCSSSNDLQSAEF